MNILGGQHLSADCCGGVTLCNNCLPLCHGIGAAAFRLNLLKKITRGCTDFSPLLVSPRRCWSAAALPNVGLQLLPRSAQVWFNEPARTSLLGMPGSMAALRCLKQQ
jgi:hypothetical protein